MEISPSDESAQLNSDTARRAPLALVALAVASGIVLAHYIAISPGTYLVSGAISAASAAICLLAKRKTLPTILLLLGLVAAGGLLHYRQYRHITPRHISNLTPDEGVFARIRGEIVSEPFTIMKAPVLGKDSEDAVLRPETAFDIEISAVIPVNGHQIGTEGRIKVKLFAENPKLMRGDEVELTGRLQHPNRPTNPAQLDYREYLRMQGIHSIMYISGDAGVEPTGRYRNSLMRQVDILRGRMLAIMSGSPFNTNSTILPAMLLGVRSELDPVTLMSFRKSGTMHLLAISGLHVGMIAGAGVLLLRLLRLPMKPANLIIIILVLLYVMLSGARSPAVRAGVLISFAMLGGVLGRRQLSFNSTGGAALAILIFDPCQIFAVGFQLSFAAFLSIIYFYEPIKAALFRLTRLDAESRNREFNSVPTRILLALRRGVLPLFAVSFAAYIGVVPLLARSFNIVSTVGLFANVLLVPLTWLVIVSGFTGVVLASLLMPLSEHAGILLAPANLFSSILDSISSAAGALPFSYFFTSGPPLWFVILYYVLLVAIIHRKMLKVSPVHFGLVGLLLVNLLAVQSVLPRVPQARLTLFDVRHGNCVLVELPSGKTLLYDCGTASNYFDVGEYVVAPVLWQRSVFKIDMVMLSHAHTDHVNGVLSLLDRFRIGKLVVPRDFEKTWTGRYVVERFRQHGVPVREVFAGEKVELGSDTIEILNPPPGQSLPAMRDSNNESIVARVNMKCFKLLLTGDIEEPAIAWLLATGQDVASEVLCMPHHGAYTVNLDELVTAVNPSIATISNHLPPRPEVIQIMEGRGVSLHATSNGGAITITANPLRVRQVLDDLQPVP